MALRVQIRVLGPLSLVDTEGRVLDLSGKKVLALIGFLATETARSHRREELAALLWGDTGDERARHNLRQALARIRQTDADLLVSAGEGVGLNPAACTVDLDRFNQLLGRDDLESLEESLGLYQGDLLAGTVVPESAFEAWLRDRRMEIRETASEAFDRLVTALILEKRKDDAVEALRRQLAIDPIRESSHVRLMELLAEAGRRSDALRQYQKCVDVLSRELNVAPSSNTQTAYQKILTRDTPSAASSVTPLPHVTDKHSELPTIAVLPFESLTGSDQEYFADGLAEDIIVSLSRFSSMVVIARESSFSHRGDGIGPEEIGKRLGARFLVKGKLRVANDRLRLSLQLVDTSSGQYLWTESFDREMHDVFTLQQEIAQTLASILVGRVEAVRIAEVRQVPFESLDAYQCVLRGKEYHHRVTLDDCQRAIEMFEQAIASDPDYALAHAWLGCALGQAMSLQPERRDELLLRAEAEAERARLLDENENESYRILAQVALQRGDLKRARSFQERALALNPNDDRSVSAMGTILTLTGKAGEGEQWVRRAMRINPYHPESVWFHLARSLFHGGKVDEALEALDRITRPGVREWIYRIAALERSGRNEDAVKALKELLRIRSDLDVEGWVSRTPFENHADRQFLMAAISRAQRPEA